MAKITMSSFFLLSALLAHLSSLLADARLAPALYVFGDSLSDPGNNNFRSSNAKVNFPPYGIDFPNGTITGRFTNGYTMADYLALSLGLHLPPPILDPRSQTTNNLEGFNYASASAGILADTGVKFAKVNLSLRKQVKLFRKTVREFLPFHLKTGEAVTYHLQKSIFFILIGSNDYTLNYINKALSDNMKKYNPDQFAEFLVNEFQRHLQDLYKLGARKFVLSEIGPLGCIPASIKTLPPGQKCVEELNGLVAIYNKKLETKITQLQSTLKNASFVTMKAQFYSRVLENPGLYGFKDARRPCCVVGELTCIPGVAPCQDRRSRVFWDDAHFTDAANKLLAGRCFVGTGFCSPIDILQLIKKA